MSKVQPPVQLHTPGKHSSESQQNRSIESAFACPIRYPSQQQPCKCLDCCWLNQGQRERGKRCLVACWQAETLLDKVL